MQVDKVQYPTEFIIIHEGKAQNLVILEQIAFSALAVIAYWGDDVPEEMNYARQSFDRIKALSAQTSWLPSDGRIAVEMVYYATHGGWRGVIEEERTKIYAKRYWSGRTIS